MGAFYKATRPDGTDFHSGTVLYEVGKRVRPRDRVPRNEAQLCGPGLLHAATVPTETLVVGAWPCRLFVVEGKPVAGLDDEHPYKAGFRQLHVAEELPAWQVFGPQGQEVVALIERAGRLIADEMQRLDAAWDAAWGAARYAAWGAARYAAGDAAGDAARYAAGDAAWDAAWCAARYAAGDAARDAARDAAWAAAGDAASAFVVRDLISDEDFRTLYGPWESVIGE